MKRRDRPPALEIADPIASSDGGDVRYDRDVASDAHKVILIFFVGVFRSLTHCTCPSLFYK